MNTPRWLSGAAALFWGALTGMWAIAVPVAVLLEAAHWTRRRFAVGEARQMRLADLCFVVTAMIAVGCYVVYGNPRAVVLMFQWLPISFLPLALLQAWGEAPAIPLRVIFWSLRRRRGADAAFNLGYPYFVALLVGACAANQRGEWMSAGLVALGAWALWPARASGAKRGIWAGEIVLAAALGSGLYFGLNGAQMWLEGAAPDWITGSGGTRSNPYRSSTDLGAVEDLKQSDAIILRVATGEPLRAPLLLHRASYNQYAGSAWLARGARFSELPRNSEVRGWRLRQGRALRSIAVADFAAHGNPVLSLPSGALAVEVEAVSMRANPLGAVQADSPPGFLMYRVALADTGAWALAPVEGDLDIPSGERAVIAATATAWQLDGAPPARVVETLRRRLADGFRYSTRGHRAAPGRTPLAEFLVATRAGHCEYFATATVLLLRKAGVPARYATGFSLQEYDPGERGYIVRERHAHAWARAFIDGAWVDVDTTPPDWNAVEARERSATSRLLAWFTDAWSTLRYRYATWQANSSEGEKWTLFGGVGAVVLAWLLWRVFVGTGRRRAAGAQAAARIETGLARLGMDSAFFGIQSRLAHESLGRMPAESARDWVGRLAASGLAPELLRDLQTLLALHQRHRFDPLGLQRDEARAFASGCADWLERHASSTVGATT